MHRIFSSATNPRHDNHNNTPSDNVGIVPTDFSTIIRFGSHCFSLPQSVTSKSGFQKSRLGLATSSKGASQFELPDGALISRISPGELQIERPDKEGTDYVGDFQLLIDQLLGRKPLETYGFATIADAYLKLVSEIKYWGLSKVSVELPYRLWTKSRWTDLAGMYALCRSDAELLKMEPVALQLDDGTVQGVRTLTTASLTSDQNDLIKVTENILTHPDYLNKVIAIFEYGDCRIFLLNLNHPSTSKSLECEQMLTPSQQVDKESPLSITSTTAASATARDCSPQYANQILLQFPHTDKVVAYDLPPHENLKVPNGRDFPLFYRRGDRHVFTFNKSFSLEVQEITDAVSGLIKIRRGISRVGSEIKSGSSNQQGSNAPTTATSMMSSLLKMQGGSDKKKDAWMCYHPQLNARYGSTIKWIKEFGEVERIKFFPWGAILVSAKTDPLFAILSIDHHELRKTYGERVAIHLRSFPNSVLTRDDVDLTATPGLERVYLCCCSQIASTSIIPQNNKIDFEIVENGNTKKYKLRLVHIDIAEGAPSGSSLESLNSVGMLSEFDPKTGAVRRVPMGH